MKRTWDRDGWTTTRKAILVGLAIVLIALLVAIPIMNSSVITGSQLIFEGRYQVSDKKEILMPADEYACFQNTNGKQIVWVENTFALPQTDVVKIYNISTEDTTTIFSGEVNDEVEFMDFNGNSLAMILINATEYRIVHIDTENNDTNMIINYTGGAVFTDLAVWEDNIVYVVDGNLTYVNVNMKVPVVLDEAAIDYFSYWCDVYEYTIVYTKYNSTLGGTDDIWKANINSGTTKLIAAGHNRDPSIWGDTVVCMPNIFKKPPPMGAWHPQEGLIYNFTGANPELKLIHELPTEQWDNIVYPFTPDITDKFAMWTEYGAFHEEGSNAGFYFALNEIETNRTWRLPITQYNDMYVGRENSPRMNGNVIVWAEYFSAEPNEYHLYYITIGNYQETMISPEMVAAVNLNAVYLLGIVGAIAVGFVGTSIITPENVKMGRVELSEEPDYYEEWK